MRVPRRRCELVYLAQVSKALVSMLPWAIRVDRCWVGSCYVGGCRYLGLVLGCIENQIREERLRPLSRTTQFLDLERKIHCWLSRAKSVPLLLFLKEVRCGSRSKAGQLGACWWGPSNAGFFNVVMDGFSHAANTSLTLPGLGIAYNE